MGWLSKVVFLVTLKYISQSSGTPNTIPLQENLYNANALPDADSNIAPALDNKLAALSPVLDDKLQRLSDYLSYVLLRPWPRTGLPLLYVEEGDLYQDQDTSQEDFQAPAYYDRGDNDDITPNLYKRSRYYRKYPWKRQNSKETYEAENPYLCQPSKDDVFRLLVALHEARQGNRGHTINFCNRKRPASVIFTNIRFLGKRK